MLGGMNVDTVLALEAGLATEARGDGAGGGMFEGKSGEEEDLAGEDLASTPPQEVPGAPPP